MELCPFYLDSCSLPFIMWIIFNQCKRVAYVIMPPFIISFSLASCVSFQYLKKCSLMYLYQRPEISYYMYLHIYTISGWKNIFRRGGGEAPVFSVPDWWGFRTSDPYPGVYFTSGNKNSPLSIIKGRLLNNCRFVTHLISEVF